MLNSNPRSPSIENKKEKKIEINKVPTFSDIPSQISHHSIYTIFLLYTFLAALPF